MNILQKIPRRCSCKQRCRTPARLYAALLLLPMLSGCLGPVTELYPEQREKRPVPVYVVSLGWHGYLAFEGDQLRDQLPQHRHMPKTDLLMIGWGDNKYYPSERVRIDLFLRAAFLPTGSVIHAVGISEPVEAYFPGAEVVRIYVSEQGFRAMADYLVKQFKLTDDGELSYTAPGHHKQSAFFKAHGWYYFPKTSNRWTARALRRSGFPISPFYAITAGNLIRQAKKHGDTLQ